SPRCRATAPARLNSPDGSSEHTTWEPTMPIDLAAVNWTYTVILSVFVFIAALLGSLIAFRNKLAGAIIAAILFAIAFVGWTYYPRDTFPDAIKTLPISPK